MNRKIKTVAAFILVIIISAGIVSGQDPAQPAMQKANRNRLTEEQKAMLQQEMAKRKEIREAFKTTLTQEQKDMLTDPRMMQSERIRAFRSSLSDDQVNMIRERQRELRTIQKPMRANLTQGQRLNLRRMALNRTQMDRQLYRRARLRQRLGRM